MDKQHPKPVLHSDTVVALMRTAIPSLRSATMRGVKHHECSKDSASIFAAIDDLAERLAEVCDMGAKQ